MIIAVSESKYFVFYVLFQYKNRITVVSEHHIKSIFVLVIQLKIRNQLFSTSPLRSFCRWKNRKGKVVEGIPRYFDDQVSDPKLLIQYFKPPQSPSVIYSTLPFFIQGKPQKGEEEGDLMISETNLRSCSGTCASRRGGTPENTPPRSCFNLLILLLTSSFPRSRGGNENRIKTGTKKFLASSPKLDPPPTNFSCSVASPLG
ncbi:hypothetical protein AVEN_242434-1 [Araneus ventricosus]|uniref:Uncharacterized protein n=1 Tax=Araneus ventricosus TaxID=182803 RepID=A0A4Y2LEK1_ARAVE|nr:hypothetical protein AVEN_242434-1 [Araneus ventricosus]